MKDKEITIDDLKSPTMTLKKETLFFFFFGGFAIDRARESLSFEKRVAPYRRVGIGSRHPSRDFVPDGNGRRSKALS